MEQLFETDLISFNPSTRKLVIGRLRTCPSPKLNQHSGVPCADDLSMSTCAQQIQQMAVAEKMAVEDGA